MSELEAMTGKLVPVDLEGLELEEFYRMKIGNPDELPEWAYSWEDAFNDEYYRAYYKSADGILYEIQAKELQLGGFTEGSKNEDGSVNFIISWYNGGASMDEVLDEVMNKIS